MSISLGQKLGPYLVEAAAGAGGMGEVYRAKDTRLDRTVAIKVLPQATQQNADLRARFEREAKAISSLNHPHICTLYDIGHEGGIDFIVMEFLEGETMAEKLKNGPLSKDDLFTYGTQIADALDSAHRKGMIHRDLKPGNVMITKEGAKLLDFGLAKLQLQQGVMDGISHVTQTTPLTGAGTIIGTIQYMAPEQLEGHEADARSDIFAFGALLYEMATGRSAFSGQSQASLIASILKEEPRPMSELISMTPPALERLVRKCLDKDPEKRWQSTRDLGDELRWIARSGSQAGVPVQVSARRRGRMRLGWGIATVASLAALVLAALFFLKPEPKQIVHRYTITAQPGYQAMDWPVISPDGMTLAFLARDSVGTERIYVRPVRSLEANVLPGTEGAGRPFWSPDSRYLAFFTNSQLKKVPVSGGPAQLIAEVRGADGCWGANGIILFDGNTTDSIRQVPASGGAVTAATRIRRDSGEGFHAWPWFLPDGNRFLYQVSMENTSLQSPRVIRLGSLDGSVDDSLGVIPSRCVFVPGDYILYSQDGLLLMQKVDLDKGEFVEGPRPIAENVASIDGNGEFSVSENGNLVYQVGESVSQSRLVWVDRNGETTGTLGDPKAYRDISLSPDEQRLAYGMRDQRSSRDDIWVMDISRQISSRLTFGEMDEIWPVWSPDGDYVMYASNEAGSYSIFRKRSNGLGDALPVHAIAGQTGPWQWLSDGQTYVCAEYSDEILVKIRDLNDSTKAITIRGNGDFSSEGQISPDGRYIAFASNESGRVEVYVQELSESGGKWQISSSGGRNPKWTKNGRELIFRKPPGEFYSVNCRTDRGYFEADLPKLVFDRPITVSNPQQFRWDVTKDGSRFILNEPLQESGETYFVSVLNWQVDLTE